MDPLDKLHSSSFLTSLPGARGAAQAICRAKARPGLWRPRATEVTGPHGETGLVLAKKMGYI